MRLVELLKGIISGYKQGNKLYVYELRKELIYNLTTHGYSEEEVKEFVNELQKVLYYYVLCDEKLSLLKEALEGILYIPREE